MLALSTIGKISVLAVSVRFAVFIRKAPSPINAQNRAPG
jgi:hypothetical protein